MQTYACIQRENAILHMTTNNLRRQESESLVRRQGEGESAKLDKYDRLFRHLAGQTPAWIICELPRNNDTNLLVH